MKLARIIASVVATQKHPAYQGERTFLVSPLDLKGDPAPGIFVAVDRAGGGVGDLVLLMQEGSSARFIVGDSQAPIRSVIVGIVDRVDTEGGEFKNAQLNDDDRT